MHDLRSPQARAEEGVSDPLADAIADGRADLAGFRRSELGRIAELYGLTVDDVRGDHRIEGAGGEILDALRRRGAPRDWPTKRRSLTP